MIDAFIDTLQSFPRGLVFVAEGLIILALAKFAKDLVTRHYRVDEEITTKSNLAVALRLSGYLIAVILILLGVLYQPLTGGGWASSADLDAAGFGFDRALGEEVLRVFLYALGGIVALNLVRVLFDRLILYKFRLEKEVVEDRNAGAGAAEFGMYVATGLLIAGAVAGDTLGGGEGKAALVALAFFGMGLVLLVAFALFYEFTTSFNIHDEIERDNVAVGVALGGNLVAIGLVTLKAGHRRLPGFRSPWLCAPLRGADGDRPGPAAHGENLSGPGRGPQHRRGDGGERSGDQRGAGPVHGHLREREFATLHLGRLASGPAQQVPVLLFAPVLLPLFLQPGVSLLHDLQNLAVS